MFESLEQRRLLAHTLEAGVLTVNGTPGHDRIQVGLREGNLVIRVNDSTPEQVPAADVNSIVINGLAGNDLLAIASNVTKDATLNGGWGSDALRGGAGDDHLDGGEGNDRLDGGLGADVMVGGGGHDGVDYARRIADLTVTLDDNADDGAAGEGDNVASDVEAVHAGFGDDTIVGSALRNQLSGGGGNDSIFGAGGNDVLLGGPGNDDLDGGEGNDQLDGGGGADDMTGGAGIDTVSYARSPVGVVVTLDGVADDGIAATDHHPAEGDNAGADIENVHGSRFNDSITGNALNNRLSGGGGNDTLRGGEGNDYLDGGHGHDQLFGEGGNDILRGRDGQADLLDGGEGDDRADRDPLDTLVSIEHSNPLPT